MSTLDDITTLRCGADCHGYLLSDGRCDACNCLHRIAWCELCRDHHYDCDMSTDVVCVECAKPSAYEGEYRSLHQLTCTNINCTGCNEPALAAE